MIDLVSLIEQTTGVSLRKIANNRLNGIEYCGACPYCGTGIDRFHVFPEAPKPHWFCRVCDKSGDAIDILRHFKNLPFVEACQELGIKTDGDIKRETSMLFDDEPPCKEWQNMARTLIERAQRFLWKDKARHALDYLRGRGLTDETIHKAQLGYIPLIDGKWFQSPFSDWGLTNEMLSERQKEKGCVRIPNGILIPWESDNQIWKLAVKRFEASKKNEPKYGQTIGSREGMYNSDSLARGKPVLLCEGEFDVLSAIQEAGNLIAPIGTGSAQKGRLPLWIARIASLASQVLIGFDNDDNQAGDEGASFWKDVFGDRAMRWPPYSHDINDMLREGKDIRRWIETGLSIAALPIQPPAREKAAVEPFRCVACQRDLYAYEGQAYIDENDKPFCETCWEKQTPLLACSKCGGLNTALYPGAIMCYRCQFQTMKLATFTTPQPHIATWTTRR